MSQQYNTSFAKSFQSTRQRMHRIRLDEVDESPHDSMTSDLACCQWHLADVLISDERCVAVLSLCVSGPSGRGH